MKRLLLILLIICFIKGYTQVLSDLVPLYLKADSISTDVGKNVTISITVKNIGDTITPGASSLRFYLSDDNYLNTSIDSFLISYGIPQLEVGDSLNVITQVIIPKVSKGKWYLISKVDAGNNITEEDETNNTAYIELYVGVFPTMIEYNYDLKNYISVYPNPVKNNLYVNLNEGEYNIRLVDIDGKILYNELSQGRNNIIMNRYSNGIYYLIIEDKRKIVRYSNIILKQ